MIGDRSHATNFKLHRMREEQRIMGSQMRGVFASAGMAGNVLDVASEDGAVTPIGLDAEAAANTCALLGK